MMLSLALAVALAGNLVISCTMPVMGDPDCTHRYARPWIGNPTLTLVLSYFGVDTFGWGIVTVKGKPGQKITLIRSVPSGTYQVSAHAVNGAVPDYCDTTIIVHTSPLPALVIQ
jgi:hypothetical protein